jgi:hypothetical protein
LNGTELGAICRERCLSPQQVASWHCRQAAQDANNLRFPRCRITRSCTSTIRSSPRHRENLRLARELRKMEKARVTPGFSANS